MDEGVAYQRAGLRVGVPGHVGGPERVLGYVGEVEGRVVGEDGHVAPGEGAIGDIEGWAAEGGLRF